HADTSSKRSTPRTGRRSSRTLPFTAVHYATYEAAKKVPYEIDSTEERLQGEAVGPPDGRWCGRRRGKSGDRAAGCGPDKAAMTDRFNGPSIGNVMKKMTLMRGLKTRVLFHAPPTNTKP
ncbi:hypothetical protein BHE74_00039125, partial [Ensete ventricosum]